MNLDTGRLRFLSKEEMEKERIALSEREIMFPLEDLTEKQKREMKVSLHDNRSPAGKKLHEARKKRRKIAKKSRKKNRK